MDELRTISRQDDLVPKDMPFANILRATTTTHSRAGAVSTRSSCIARYKFMRPRTMMDDVLLGMKMFTKGKISSAPDASATAGR